MILTKHPPGCQYINMHNAPIEDMLNCNTNAQIGNGCQGFYCTLYTSKSTQEEDSERKKSINDAIIRLPIKQKKAAILDVVADKSTVDNAFVDGWYTMLRGMNTATSQDIVSSTMTPLLTTLDGTQFQYSHNFANLLIGQLKATLDGQAVDARIRTNKRKTAEINSGQTRHLMTIFIGQTKQSIFIVPICHTVQQIPKSFTLINIKGA